MEITYEPVGTVLPPPERSADHFRRLSIRRSTPAQTIGDPGPSEEDVGRMLLIGARTPDHGKLAPWRFVIMDRAAKDRLADRLAPLAREQPSPDKALAVLAKLRASPLAILVVSRVTPGHKIPEWEQALSAGSVCMNLLHAADALGHAANWITDWYAYDPRATALYGVAPDEKVAGFIHVGAPTEPSLERARPDLALLVSRLD